MGVKATTKVWEWSNSEGNDRLVLLALADFADDDGYCFPGVARIAAKCRISERTVQRCIKTLTSELKELEVIAGAGIETKNGYTNKYRLVISQKRDDKLSPVPSDGVTKSTVRGDNSGSDGVTALSPNPSVEPSDKPLDSATRKAKRFTKPGIDDMMAYGKEIGISIHEVSAFDDHHEARGWKLQTGPMVDWKAAMRTWKRNAEKFAPRGFQKPGQSRAASDPDTVWQGDLWLLCEQLKKGEPFDADYVLKKFKKAMQYVTRLTVADYLVAQLEGHKSIYDRIHAMLIRVDPGEGNK